MPLLSDLSVTVSPFLLGTAVDVEVNGGDRADGHVNCTVAIEVVRGNAFSTVCQGNGRNARAAIEEMPHNGEGSRGNQGLSLAIPVKIRQSDKTSPRLGVGVRLGKGPVSVPEENRKRGRRKAST